VFQLLVNKNSHRNTGSILHLRVCWRKEEGSDYAIYLTHDLSMLRLIETFCESAPQLILMIYVMLRTNKARTVQCESHVAASTTSIAWMVVDYHRSLRSFLPDKAKQHWGSSLMYFLWNLLLIGPRVAALALFSSVLPDFIALHFLLLWLVFVLWVWQQRTNFMDSAGGEWLYRATVGLIWYFSWFNVAEGRTLGRSIIYHSFITVDVVVLLATWWGYRDRVQTKAYGLALLIALPLTYLLGLLFKALYYCCFHPKLLRHLEREPRLQEDLAGSDVAFRDFSTQDGTPASQLCNQRMACHAANFYTNSFLLVFSLHGSSAASQIKHRELPQSYLCGHEGLCGEKLNSLGCRDELQALFKNPKTDLDHVLSLIYIIPINVLAQNISFPKYSHRLIIMIQYLFPVFPMVSL
ncbi:XK- protein 8, partial [Xenoophorus captivus]